MLEVPKGKILPTLGDRAFCYAAPKLWNNLSGEISGLLFTTASVVFITAKIAFIFTSLTAV